MASSSTTPSMVNINLELTLYKDHWMIKKELEKSDVDGNCRLLLRSNEVKKYILPLMDEDMAQRCATGDGVRFSVWDADDRCSHDLVLKKWRKCDYFVLVDKWRTNFVTRKGLEVGDMVGLTFDGSEFYFKLLGKKVK